MIGLTLYGGYYIDSGRATLEQLIKVPPNARYAIERNHIPHNETWVYRIKEDVVSVREFYRNHAHEQGIVFIEDEMRMSFVLPSGELFLTLTQENEMTTLYFSREGESRIIVVQ